MHVSTSASNSEALNEGDNAVLTEWKQVLDEISRFLCDCDRNKEVANLARAEYMREHLEHIFTPHTLVQDYVCDNPVCEATSYLAENLITLEEQLSVDLAHWQEKVDLPMDEYPP